MNKTEREGELSELQRIEFYRRYDKLASVLFVAGRLFHQKLTADADAEKATKASGSKWYLFFLILGAALHYLLSDKGQWDDVGVLVMVFTYFFWVGVKIDSYRYHKASEDIKARIEGLEIIWRSAICDDSFWDIKRFSSDGELNFSDPEFRRWWVSRRKNVIAVVCRGSDIESEIIE